MSNALTELDKAQLESLKGLHIDHPKFESPNHLHSANHAQLFGQVKGEGKYRCRIDVKGELPWTRKLLRWIKRIW